MLNGLIKVLQLLEKIPGVGKHLKGATQEVEGWADSMHEKAANKMNDTQKRLSVNGVIDSASNGFDLAGKATGEELADSFGKDLDATIKRIGDFQNKNTTAALNMAKPEGKGGTVPEMETHTGVKLGPAFASSMMKIGGGGVSVGVGSSDPLLSENQKQTRILESINNNLKPKVKQTTTEKGIARFK